MISILLSLLGPGETSLHTSITQVNVNDTGTDTYTNNHRGHGHGHRSLSLDLCQTDGNMDPKDRQYSNYNGNDRHQQYNDRHYPTTPSTFPQPVFDVAAGPGAYGTGGGYFMNNPYPSQYPQPQGYHQNYQVQPQSSYQPSPAGYNQNDGPDGLVHQFAHQNLGPAARQAPGYPRQQSPAQRSRTPGTPGTPGQPQYGSYLNPAMSGYALPRQTTGGPPEKTPDVLPDMCRQRGSVCREYVSNFFKQSLHRARERNER